MPLSPACMSATSSVSAYISFITDYLHTSLIIHHAFNTDTTCIFGPYINQCSMRTQQEAITVARHLSEHVEQVSRKNCLYE